MVEIPAGDIHTQQPKVHEQLVLVAGEVLEVDQQQGEQGLTFRNEHGGDLTAQIGVSEDLEALADMLPVQPKPAPHLRGPDGVVPGKLLQLQEVTEAVRRRRTEPRKSPTRSPSSDLRRTETEKAFGIGGVQSMRFSGIFDARYQCAPIWSSILDKTSEQ